MEKWSIAKVKEEAKKIALRKKQLTKWHDQLLVRHAELEKHCPHPKRYYQSDPAGSPGDWCCPDCDWSDLIW